MGTIIAVANQKGGVGKTTTVLNLGAALQEAGRRVLLVDIDPQASLTLALGTEDSERYIDQWFETGKLGTGTRERQITATTATTGTADNGRQQQAAAFSGAERRALPGLGGLEIIPSRFKLADLERQLAAAPDGQQWLRRALDGIKIAEQYDYILIDCPPSLGLLSVTALVAADWVLIPMQCDYLALRGVTLTLKAIQTIQQRANPKLEVLGLVPTIYNPRTVHSAEVVAAAQEHLGELVLNTTVRYSAWLKKSPVAGESVLTYAGHAAVAEDYRNLAQEVISHVE